MDLRHYTGSAFRADLLAAITVLFMTIPQGIAYAMIAGLPPAMGLYASILPTLLGALTRSSRFVLAGPTNAVSLLVGLALATSLATFDPYTTAITLAFMVGIFQFTAGLLGLGTVIDFISRPVVLGYITGAGILIGIGQLPNLTASPGTQGDVWTRLTYWMGGLGAVDYLSLLLGLLTAAGIVAQRHFNRKLPGPMIALSLTTIASYFLGFADHGIKVVSDLAPITLGLPPLTLPDLSQFDALLSVAIAAAVLSLVESSAVARSIASRTGQSLNISTEFMGQGMANLAAGLTGGYPVSGSLSRSVLNEQAGAVSRMAGILGALLTAGALLSVGPFFNHTPVPALAGVLLVVAWDLVDKGKIKLTLRSGWPDRLTFLATVIGTWTLPLDKAIYVGVAVSFIFFLRQTRQLTVRELIFESGDRLREYDPQVDDEAPNRCQSVRILQIEGRLFYGVEGELTTYLDHHIHDPSVQVLLLRLKRTQGMDISIATLLMEKATQLQADGRHLVLVGLRPAVVTLLENTGIAAHLGNQNIYPSKAHWFRAMRAGLKHAQSLMETQHDEDCPLKAYLEAVDRRQAVLKSL